MPTGTGDNFSSSYFNAPVVTGGRISGNVSSHGNMTVHSGLSSDTVTELLALLTALRREVEAAGPAVPKQEVVLDTIDDLTADAQAAQANQAVEPAVPRSRWEKIRALLSGATQVTADLAKIGQSVAQVFGHG